MPFTCGPYPFLLPGTRTQCPGLEQPPCNHEAECHTLGREGLEPNGFGPLRTALRGTDPTAVRPWASGLLQHRQLRLPEMAGSRLCSQGPAASLQRPPPQGGRGWPFWGPFQPLPRRVASQLQPTPPRQGTSTHGWLQSLQCGRKRGRKRGFQAPSFFESQIPSVTVTSANIPGGDSPSQTLRSQLIWGGGAEQRASGGGEASPTHEAGQECPQHPGPPRGRPADLATLDPSRILDLNQHHQLLKSNKYLTRWEEITRTDVKRNGNL